MVVWHTAVPEIKAISSFPNILDNLLALSQHSGAGQWECATWLKERNFHRWLIFSLVSVFLFEVEEIFSSQKFLWFNVLFEWEVNCSVITERCSRRQNSGDMQCNLNIFRPTILNILTKWEHGLGFWKTLCHVTWCRWCSPSAPGTWAEVEEVPHSHQEEPCACPRQTSVLRCLHSADIDLT